MRRFAPLVLLALVLVATASPVTAQDDAAIRLALLGRVWGLAKYFHPDITAGNVDWDAVLIETIPRVMATTTSAQFNDEAAPAETRRSGAAIARRCERDAA